MSDDIDGEQLQQAFLRGNSNAAYIGQQLADVVRSLLRLAVNGNSGTTALSASHALQTVLQLAQRAPEGLTFYDIVRAAVEDLEPAEPRGPVEEACLYLAKDGVRYFVELSSVDGFGAARASKRRDALRRGARDLEADITMRLDVQERMRTRKIPTADDVRAMAARIRSGRKPSAAPDA